MSILSVAAALVVANLTPVVMTTASWTGSEWDHGEVGTLSCSDAGIFKTRGSGQMLSGGLLPADLDDVATVGGVTVTNDGVEAHPQPVTANQVGDAYVNALDVGVLGLVDLPLTGGTLDDVLSLPFATEAGVVNQYALADDNGVSQGASGVVNDSGFIQTDSDDNGDLPSLGTLELSTLVEELTGEAISDLVAGITDLQLEIGAVASRTSFDACEAAWTNDLDANLDREYAIAGLALGVEAPAVAGLSGTLDGALTALETTVEGLLGSSGVVSEITAGVDALINSLNIAEVSTSGSYIALDLSAARSLATATISDSEGAVSLDLASGEVQVDLASLIGEAYGGEGFNGSQAHGLNGLAPNTELIVNGPVTNALVAALTEALDGWVASVLSSVNAALDIAQVHVELGVILSGTVYPPLAPPVTLNVAQVTVEVDGTLRQLLDGQLRAEASLELMLLGGALDPLIALLVNPLISGILSALTGGVVPLVGGILDTAIFGEGGLVPNLGATLASATAPVVTVLSTALADVLGGDGLVSLRANVQNNPAAGNNPDPDPSLTYPDWEVGASAVPDDQYDVAALSIGVLSGLGSSSNVNLELARSSVGVNCAVGGVWDVDGRCAGY